jgi:glutamate---cysteine ligase / carboxylate-amine ligase
MHRDGMTLERPAFGASPSFAVGAEEELLLVDPMSGTLANTGPEVVERGNWSRGQAVPEICRSVIEFVTPVCAHAAEATEVLSVLRAEARAARSTLLGAGVHPNGRLGDVARTPGARYDAVAASLRGLLQRTPHCGLHVHVGMPDQEIAVRALNGMRKWLPMLIALGANSPFWHGCDSGLASARTVIARSLPRSGPPPVVRDYDDYRAVVDALVVSGELIDFREVWWDVRLQPAFGTLEVRALDAQSSLRDLTGLVALVHCLALHEAQAPDEVGPSREVLDEAIFRAFRDGRCATLYFDGALRPLPAIVEKAVARTRSVARDLNCDGEALEAVRMAREGNGADRQRRWFARGAMPGLLGGLIDETASSFAPAAAVAA